LVEGFHGGASCRIGISNPNVADFASVDRRVAD
jgi:hypothetical protein